MMSKEIQQVDKAPTMEPAKKDLNLYLGGLWTVVGTLNLANSIESPVLPGEFDFYLFAAVLNFAILPLAIGNRRIRLSAYRRKLKAWEEQQKQLEAAVVQGNGQPDDS